MGRVVRLLLLLLKAEVAALGSIYARTKVRKGYNDISGWWVSNRNVVELRFEIFLFKQPFLNSVFKLDDKQGL